MDNKAFVGWADSNTATAKQYNTGGSITLQGDKTIYAVYTDSEPESHTFVLTLNANGGSFPTGTTTTASCTTTTSSCSVTIPNVTPTMDNKAFVGWADSNTATVATYANGGIINLSGGKTIYAVYINSGSEQSDNANLSSIEVHFKINGKSMDAELDPEFSEDITDYEIFIPEGFDMNAFGDVAVMVEVGKADDRASLSSDTVSIDDYTDLTTITVTAEDGTEKEYRLTIHYGSREIPDTDEKPDLVPNVPNTGFMLKDRSGSKQAELMTMLVIVAVAVLGIIVRISSLKKTMVENESIIFIDKK
jgi:hypothetical protein